MREMTRRELDTVYPDYRCIFCGLPKLVRGPRGGLMVNVECAHCMARLNVVDPQSGMFVNLAAGDYIPLGQVICGPLHPDEHKLPLSIRIRCIVAPIRRTFRRMLGHLLLAK